MFNQFLPPNIMDSPTAWHTVRPIHALQQWNCILYCIALMMIVSVISCQKNYPLLPYTHMSSVPFCPYDRQFLCVLEFFLISPWKETVSRSRPQWIFLYQYIQLFRSLCNSHVRCQSPLGPHKNGSDMFVFLIISSMTIVLHMRTEGIPHYLNR